MKEKIKSYILLVLIVSAIVQVGILWSYQYHGFPTSFLKAFLASNGGIPGDSQLREEYFVPFRIVASDGNESHWIISRNSNEFNRLWDNARDLLKQVLESRQAGRTPQEDWGAIVTKRGFVFEFKTNIPFELLKWFLELPASQEGPSGLHKMMVVPELYGGMTLYLLDGEAIGGRVLAYSLNAAAGGQQVDIYRDTLSKLEKDEEKNSLSYSVIRELYRGITSINPDILCVAAGSSSKYRKYRSISYEIPNRISDLEQAAGVIFRGNEKDSFDSYEDSNASKVFMNLDNIYRIYENGLLEYRYIPGYEGAERGSVSSAFVIAAQFVNRVRSSLNPGTDIYISGISEQAQFYEFAFDYMQGDVPVYIDEGPQGESAQPVRNAIVVRANGRRMLECRWMLKSIETEAGPGSYNLSHEYLLDASGLSSGSVNIKDMGVAYLVNSGEGKSEPVWVIETSGGKNYFVKLEPRQGE